MEGKKIEDTKFKQDRKDAELEEAREIAEDALGRLLAGVALSARGAHVHYLA